MFHVLKNLVSQIFSVTTELDIFMCLFILFFSVVIILLFRR